MRNDSVFGASGVPAAPNVAGLLAELGEYRVCGWRFRVVQVRRGLDSRRQSTSTKKGLSSTSSSGASPRRLPAT
jgi:hypothetical protein